MGVTFGVFELETVAVPDGVVRVLGVPSAEDVVVVVAFGDDDEDTVASEVLDVLAEGELETVATGDRVDVGVFSVEDVPVIEGDELAEELPEGDSDTVAEEVGVVIDVRLAGGEAELVAVELAEAVPVLVTELLGETEALGDDEGVDVIDFVASGDREATEEVDGDLDDDDVFEFDADDVVVLETFAVAEDDLELVIDGVLAAVDVVVRELFVVGLVDVVGSEEREAFAELVVETDAVPDRVTDVEAVLVLDTDAEGVDVGVMTILLVGLLETDDEIVAAVDGVLTGVTEDDTLGSDDIVAVTVPDSLSVGKGVALLVAEAADDADDWIDDDPVGVATGESVGSEDEDGVLEADTEPDDEGLAELDTVTMALKVDVREGGVVRVERGDRDDAGLDVVDFVGNGDGVVDFDRVDVFV